MPTLFRLALALLVPIFTCAAQEPTRDRIFGEVRDRDGRAFAGATVTLLHVANPSVVDAQYADTVTATTDDRGRFGAHLLVGMPYVAWASGPVQAGTYRCTNVATEVFAGVPVLLQEGEPRWQRIVQPRLDASWTQGLRFLATIRLGQFRLQTPLTLIDGTLRLPPLPADTIGILAFEGERNVFSTYLPTTQSAAPHDLPIGARTAFHVRLVDYGDQPIAGLRVHAEDVEPRPLLGTSGADGVVQVLRAGDQRFPTGLVSGQGFAESRLEADELIAASEGPPKDKRLARGATVRGRLLWGEGQPAAGVPLLLDASVAIGKAGTWFGIETRLLTTGADGAFAVHGRIEQLPFRLAVVLSAADRMRWQPDGKAAPVAPVALLLQSKPGRNENLGDIRLDKLAAIDVSVVGVDGGIAGPVRIVVIPIPKDADASGYPPCEPLVARTDRHGRVRLLANEGCDLAIWAMTRAGAAWVVAASRSAEHRLSLDARHRLSLRLVDAAQKPLANASIDVVVPEGSQDANAARLLPFVRQAFLVHGFPWKFGRPDNAGHVDLVMPFFGGSVDLAIQVDEQSMRSVLAWPEASPGQRTDIVFEPNGR